MDRVTAEEILRHMHALDAPLNAAMHAVEKIEDASEKKLLRKALASIVGLVYTDVIVKIEKRFPDLAAPPTGS
jgi:hypothetical protein